MKKLYFGKLRAENASTHRDSAGSNVLYAGGFEFRQVDGFKTTQYTYDGNGSLTTDRNKGIAKMEYDLLGHPRRVQFRDGHVIEYVYAPDGTKLRTVWRTAVSGISVAYGQTHELTAVETLFRDSTDYAGRFLLKGSAMDRTCSTEATSLGETRVMQKKPIPE